MSTVAVSSGSVVATAVTGGVAVAGAAIIGVGVASYKAFNYVTEETEAFLAKNNEAVDQLDSPQAMAQLAAQQMSWLMKDAFFMKQTKHLSESQQEQLAGAYVTANTPLEVSYTELVVKNNQVNGFNNLISVAARDFGETNFRQVAGTLELTASEFGFDQKYLRFSNGNSKVWSFQKKDTEEQMTVVVSKDPDNQATTMAVDLHGYDCNTDRCTNVMNEFEASLKQKGLEFSFKKERHDLPEGKLLNKVKAKKKAPKASPKSISRKRVIVPKSSKINKQ